MATKQPVKYDNAHHDVFAPGDTVPPGIAPQFVGGAIQGDGTTGNPLRIVGGGTGGPGPAGPAGTPPQTQDGGGLRWTYNPTTRTLQVDAVISPDPDNCLQVVGGGLFVACDAEVPPPPPPPPPTTLVAPALTEFGCHFRASSHDAAATSRIRFNPDGTWQVLHGTYGNIAHASGTWHNGVPNAPAAYQIRITGTEYKTKTRMQNGAEPCDPVADTTIPYDTGWVSLGSSVEQVVSVFAQANVYCSENAVGTNTFTVEIREVALPTNTVTASGSICAEADAMSN